MDYVLFLRPSSKNDESINEQKFDSSDFNVIQESFDDSSSPFSYITQRLDSRNLKICLFVDEKEYFSNISLSYEFKAKPDSCGDKMTLPFCMQTFSQLKEFHNSSLFTFLRNSKQYLPHVILYDCKNSHTIFGISSELPLKKALCAISHYKMTHDDILKNNYSNICAYIVRLPYDVSFHVVAKDMLECCNLSFVSIRILSPRTILLISEASKKERLCEYLEMKRIQTIADVWSELQHQFSNVFEVHSILTSRILPPMEHLPDLNIPRELSEEFKCRILEASSTISYICNNYQPESYCLAFTGGKDCLVVFYILLQFFYNKFPPNIWNYSRLYQSPKVSLSLLYVSKNPFPQLEEFLYRLTVRYGLNLLEINETSGVVGMKNSVSLYLKLFPSVQFCFMGSRKSDPRGENLQIICKTDSDWPDLFRVNPLLNWSYHNVWWFLKIFKLPYCSLYDQGYTSIGSVLETTPNYSLRINNENGSETFLPPHQLHSASDERLNRK